MRSRRSARRRPGVARSTCSSTACTAVELPSGQRNIYLGGNVVASCPSQSLVLRSDSLEAYGDEGRFFFVGRVNYAEPRLRLKSDYPHVLPARRAIARLLERRHGTADRIDASRQPPRVLARDPERAAAARDFDGRPTITIIEKDSAGRPQPPVTVTGNTIWLEGDSTVASLG